MTDILIAVTSTSFSKNDILRKELSRFFPTVRFNISGERLEGARLVEFITGAEGLIVGLEEIDRNVIDGLSRTKIISKYGVGLDNIDTQYCSLKGIKIGCTSGVNRISVAEMTVAFMIALSRNLYFTSNQLKNGIWNKHGGKDLSGKTVGIIGVGNVGKEVIRFLRPFGNRVLGNDIIDQKDYYRQNGVIEATKDEIYRQCEIVSLHVPLTPRTVHMINKNVFASMRKDSFLINTSRGKVIEESSLKWALLNGVISGAAIDVYEKEPPEDGELLSLSNLICTPHIGGNSMESVLAMGRSAIRHLVEFFQK